MVGVGFCTVRDGQVEVPCCLRDLDGEAGLSKRNKNWRNPDGQMGAPDGARVLPPKPPTPVVRKLQDRVIIFQWMQTEKWPDEGQAVGRWYRDKKVDIVSKLKIRRDEEKRVQHRKRVRRRSRNGPGSPLRPGEEFFLVPTSM
ncbi:UNVERIFIED_CONTAM: hypothetical protein PYX00_003740 [Menopon gallinae]|uniref:Uncharacterized protein n=1 Tax=Menopon gallinae TaxID=328185 RepID=A0AAW2I147_9NEOP